jgi:hypothetical protein
MCGDHGTEAGDVLDRDDALGWSEGLTRRGLLRAGLGFTAGLAFANKVPMARALGAGRFAVHRNSAGERTIRLAAHIHGSGSEGDGSLDSHFAQAVGLGFDAVCPTDHDWRIVFRNYRRDYHFAGVSESGPDGGTWDLRTAQSGPLASGSVAEITPLSCPLDPAPVGEKGTLHLVAHAAGRTEAGYTVTVSSNGATQNYHGTVEGRTPTIAVLPLEATPHAWMGVEFSLSRDSHNGLKSILYRLRPDLVRRRVAVSGGKATIDVPVTLGQWNTVTFDLLSDVAACWPSIVAEDTAFYRIQLLASAKNKATVDGHFAYLHIDYDPRYDGLAAYERVLDRTSASYPGVLRLYGLEHSVDVHVGQYGGRPFIYPYPDGPLVHPRLGDLVALDQVRHIQAHGGVATANHPWGTSQSITTVNRASSLARRKQQFLRLQAYGADGIEVYDARGGMDLAGHLSLLWMLWSNGVFITPLGVSDDHSGRNWLTQRNRFYMVPWGATVSRAGVQAAIRNGRMCVGRLGDFAGALDFTLDGKVRMGEVGVNPAATTRSIAIEAFGLPAGATVDVLQGAVSYDGADTPDPVVVASFTARQLAAGSNTATLHTRDGAHISLMVRDRNGKIVAFTAAAWALRRSPSGGRPRIPASRLVAA